MLLTIISLLVITPVGFFTKWYTGPASGWVQNNLGGLLYVVFWCLAARLVLRRVHVWKIVIVVLAITCCLEVLQLWHPTPLECIRSTFIGKTLFGTTFSVKDFPYYVAGALLGWLWLRSVQKLE